MAMRIPSTACYPHVLAEIEQLLAARTDPRRWLEENLWIRTKHRTVVSLQLNAMQAHYYAHRTGRDLLLKARQLGSSTICSALLFAETVLEPNTTAVIVAHDADASQRIFQIVHLFLQQLPIAEQQVLGRPQILNRREIYWPQLNSRCYVGTAGSLTFGRGQTINNLLCSEYAFWPKPQEALIALTEAVPPEGRIVIESTANGMGHPFHELWTEAKAGENDYRPHFYPWWWDPEYRLAGEPLTALTEEEQRLVAAHRLTEEQLRWRRAKQRQLRERFPQEYPEDDVTCFLASGRCVFDTIILTALQQRVASEPAPEDISTLPGKQGPVSFAPARLLLWHHPQPKHTYILGADVGGGGAYGDASAALVLDYETGEQVAALHGRIPPEQFAQLLDALGRYFNKAELVVERNNHGHSTLNTLQHTCEYPNLYRHTDYNNPHDHHGPLGWLTDSKSKPLMIDGLAAALGEGAFTLHDTALLDECFSYMVTESGGTEAQPGKHDDRVIAAAIAWQVRQRPKMHFFIARL